MCLLRCLVTECEDPANTTLHPLWLSNAVPYTNDVPTTCSRYTVQNATDSCSTTVFTEEIESCDAWVYDPEEHTILNEVSILNMLLFSAIDTLRRFFLCIVPNLLLQCVKYVEPKR